MARFRARSDERARQRPAVKCIRCEMSYLAATTILPEAMLDVQDQCNESNVLNASASPLDCPEVSYTPYGQRVETYVVPVVFACILVVGVLGNTVLIITICRHATMRNVPNTYVLSLAIGDLLVILICVPFTFAVYVLDSWPFGLALCRLSEFAKDVSVGVSVFTLTALSADRFFAIVDPMRKLHATGSGKRAKWFTKIVAFLIWMLATFCAIPATFSYIRVFKVNKNVTFLTCYPFPDQFGPNYPKTVVICRFCIFYVVPLSIIAVFYILMARHLMQSTRNIPGEKQGQISAVLLLLVCETSGLAVVVEPPRTEFLLHDLATSHELTPWRSPQCRAHGQLAAWQCRGDDQSREIDAAGTRDHRHRLPKRPRAAHMRSGLPGRTLEGCWRGNRKAAE
ncbi:neuropeptide CCHamide-1 receptor-like isoform X2 [Phymastichus coffea]|uniref:neuropeptide CCHamide-1 receptor-like isoform X2 n=1 Tax=Phymastichus coffea TaxID=108790 RepID=UPI00273CD73A|nr:neuropeptide CCHamide-1 receptor-like isoform X2 [Phymastichus coffea]